MCLKCDAVTSLVVLFDCSLLTCFVWGEFLVTIFLWSNYKMSDMQKRKISREQYLPRFKINNMYIMHILQTSLENVVTCIIVAKGIKGLFSIHIGVNNDSGVVLCTVLVRLQSQDDSGHVAGPAVPEWCTSLLHFLIQFATCLDLFNGVGWDLSGVLTLKGKGFFFPFLGRWWPRKFTAPSSEIFWLLTLKDDD